MAKLHLMPTSYEEVVAHPELYGRAPNPATDMAGFNTWVRNLMAAYGDENKIKPNVYISALLADNGTLHAFTAFNEEAKGLLPTTDTPQFFYYIDSDGTVVPGLILTFKPKIGGFDNHSATGTMILILDKTKYASTDGWDVFKYLANGGKIWSIGAFEAQQHTLSEEENSLIANGLNLSERGGTEVGYRVGVGFIVTDYTHR
jgi:hypothetical protein